MGDRRSSIAGTRRLPPIPALAPTRRSAILPVRGAEGRRTSLPGAPSGYTQSWSFQAPMYMVASADTVISSNAGGFQAHRLGRGTTVFRAMAVTSFPAGLLGEFPGPCGGMDLGDADCGASPVARRR